MKVLNSEFKLDTDDLNDLIVCAFRYALGRRTYIVHTITEIIKANLSALESRTIEVMLQDIERQHEYEKVGIEKAFGDDCDRERWMEVEVLLNAEKLDRLGREVW